MREESAQSFPRQNNYEIIYGYIDSELKKAGIILERLKTDVPNNTCIVTTNIEVPVEIMSNIREHVENKGFTIKFLHSG